MYYLTQKSPNISQAELMKFSALISNCRCVDEINQGMDPDNERKIFDMLVRHVAQSGQSQFFYVTPKVFIHI